jgi:hypothetical protein
MCVWLDGSSWAYVYWFSWWGPYKPTWLDRSALSMPRGADFANSHNRLSGMSAISFYESIKKQTEIIDGTDAKTLAMGYHTTMPSLFWRWGMKYHCGTISRLCPIRKKKKTKICFHCEPSCSNKGTFPFSARTSCTSLNKSANWWNCVLQK